VPPPRIHPTALVSERAVVEDGAQIWLHCQIREEARIGAGTILGKNVYVDSGVQIGRNVKIQNNVSVFHGVTLEDGVFVGPHVCFTNDKEPRAVNPDLSLKGTEDWIVSPTVVKTGAAIGANATILCGITLGEWSMVGAGSVVTKDVPPYALVAGCPARVLGYVCACGKRVTFAGDRARCVCGRDLEVAGDGSIRMSAPPLC
jgi:acetyltransferase-like isoleucine patch superfamily enzyme